MRRIDSKTYPTYDDLGQRFRLSWSATFSHLKFYFPLVQEAWSRLGVLPPRIVRDLVEFRMVLAGVEEILIDMIERRRAPPNNPVQQQDCYCGKKNRHTAHNTVSTTLTRFLFCVERTFGERHQNYHISPPLPKLGLNLLYAY